MLLEVFDTNMSVDKATQTDHMHELPFDDLPDEPELAFLYLEQIFHAEVTEMEKLWGDQSPPSTTYLDYMGKTVAAAKELGINDFSNYIITYRDGFDFTEYYALRHTITTYTTAVQIRYARRNRSFSVRLSAAEKTTIRHHTQHIRQMILETEMDASKREKLLDKLAAFEAEVDKDRTKFESYGAAVIEIAGFVGEAAKKLEPVRRIMDSIAKIIHGSKEEETKRLPPPDKPKQIEHKPHSPSREPSRSSSTDEEIPF